MDNYIIYRYEEVNIGREKIPNGLIVVRFLAYLPDRQAISCNSFILFSTLEKTNYEL